jgi:3-oxoacyl-[acyl-carrier protein] reductase
MSVLTSGLPDSQTSGLSRRHICVVGGSRGIGAAAARTAAARGATVSLTYRSEKDKADALAKDIGGKAYQADVVDEKAFDAAIDRAVAECGPLRGMVISAGVFEHLTIEKMTSEFWNRTISINLTGTMLAVRAAQRHLRHGQGGSIVIYTSTAGQSGGGGGASAYCVSKAGQIMFMKCMASELGSAGVRVNCIAPAWTETEMADKHLERLGRENVAKQFPLGRIGRPEDVADATAFLLGDDARFITGVTLTVDGGMAMRG